MKGSKYIANTFREILGSDNVFDSIEKRIAYSSDASKVTGDLPDVIARSVEAPGVMPRESGNLMMSGMLTTSV